MRTQPVSIAAILIVIVVCYCSGLHDEYKQICVSNNHRQKIWKIIQPGFFRECKSDPPIYFFTTSAATIAATEKEIGRSVDRNCRQEGEEFCIFPLQRLLSCPDSRSPFPPPALLSRRIALVSLRLFSSISDFRSASDPAGAQVLVVRRRMLLASRFSLFSSPVLPRSRAASVFHLNVSSVFCPLVPPLLLYLHTSRDNVGRRWHSRVQDSFVRVRRNP